MAAPGIERPPQVPRPARNWLVRAWVSVALIPVGFFLAFAVGEGIYSLLGYAPGFEEAPFWVDLVSGVPALVLFVAPCAAAALYGHRAHRAGERWALPPVLIGTAAGLYLLVLAVGTSVADAFG